MYTDTVPSSLGVGAAELVLALVKVYMAFALVGLVIGIILLIANWKIFSKAGEHGWAAIVPFYCNYVFAKITWGSGWMFLVPIGCATVTLIVPSVAALCALVSLAYSALSCWKLSAAFGHGVGFAAGLWFFSFVFFPILAFGKSQYLGVPQDALSIKRNGQS